MPTPDISLYIFVCVYHTSVIPKTKWSGTSSTSPSEVVAYGRQTASPIPRIGLGIDLQDLLGKIFKLCNET